jgi:hypothetical protein
MMSPLHIVTVRRWQILVAFAGVTIAFTIQGAFLLRLINRNDAARRALCAQRHDLDQRIDATSKILKQYRGKLVFGIPRTLIVVGRDRDKVTRQNLEILDCKA